LLASATRTFADNLSALRDFVALVGSLLDKRHEELARTHPKDFVPLLLLPNKVKPSLSEQKLQELETKFGDNVQIEEGESKNGKKTWTLKVSDDKWNADLVMKHMRTDAKHRDLLYRSSLISLVSSAEWFLSQVIRAYFDRVPGAAGTEGKTLTLEDLKSIGTVEDAQRYLVDQRIDEIMWG
jgi:hypothetical protein